MDPLMHLLLPMLFLLAIRMDAKAVLLFAPLAILPDFDAALELHRVVFHSFVPIVVLPVGLILYAKLRRPAWLLNALIVQFYLASHVVLDMGGVAFLWPFVQEQLYFDPQVTFNLQGGINFGFEVEYGWKEYVPMGTTQFVSETGFATIFLGILMLAFFRKEAFAALGKAWNVLRDAVGRLSR